MLALDGGQYATRFTGREGTVPFDLGPCAAEVEDPDGVGVDVARLWRR